MARTPGTESTLAAVDWWRDRCLLGDTSVFTDRRLWTREHVVEIETYFVERPDTGDRSFMDKLKDQLAPTSPEAKQLAAEMLWLLLLFPNNVSGERRIEIVSTVWGWSGDTLPPGNEMLHVLDGGIGSAGQGYNNYRPLELELCVRMMLEWKALDKSTQDRVASDPWAFGEFVDHVEGANRRQFRHMILHLLFPDHYERIASSGNKEAIDSAFADELRGIPLSEGESATTLLGRDRRLYRIRQQVEARSSGKFIDFYDRDLSPRWRPPDGTAPPRPPTNPPAPGPSNGSPEYREPDLASVFESISAVGLTIDGRTLRRYHLALKSRGFVILSGVSGTGKSWLAEAYADAVSARKKLVPVAPNWTSNEDLLGFPDPFGKGYRDTEFSHFVREAATTHAEARRAGKEPQPFHLILDEMNLARVEYYFAKFLSVMEMRMRGTEALLELGPGQVVPLTPNLVFVGTVNVDETTHGFADKIYDRAQLIEMPLSRELIERHLASAPYRIAVLEIWDAVHDVAPFAFRVLDDIAKYVEGGRDLGVSWEELLDELIVQKVLTKIRGTDPRVGEALQRLELITLDDFPLAHEKVRAMASGFAQNGIASFF